MRRLFLTVVTILAVLTTVSLALAPGGQSEIPWYTIAGGGTTVSQGGDFGLSGVAGQPVAGPSSGGIYALSGGIWKAKTAPDGGISPVYLPLIRR
jgi:hypothetical protein